MGGGPYTGAWETGGGTLAAPASWGGARTQVHGGLERGPSLRPHYGGGAVRTQVREGLEGGPSLRPHYGGGAIRRCVLNWRGDPRCARIMEAGPYAGACLTGGGTLAAPASWGGPYAGAWGTGGATASWGGGRTRVRGGRQGAGGGGAGGSGGREGGGGRGGGKP